MKTLQQCFPRTGFGLPIRNLGFLACLTLVSSEAHAQTFDFTLNPATSSTNFDALFTLNLPGSVIGDFDATSNPTGTTTIPGLFGGSGNNAISIDLGIGGDVDFMGVPSGVFSMDISTTDLTVSVEGLSLDLLGGATASSPITVDLLYDTFRTVNPGALFIGNIPISLPIGNQSVSDVLFEQNAASIAGTLTPGANAGEYTFAVLVPVDVSLNVDVFGFAAPIGPLPLAIPLAGEVVVDANGATATVGFSQMANQSIKDPLGGFEVNDIPFPLPTILPPGGTANLLLTATIGSVDFGIDVSATFVADGSAPCGFSNYCTANLNSVGLEADILATGSPLVTDGDLTLTSSNLPVDVFGFYLMSPAQDVMPLGNGSQGFLCLGLPCYRLRDYIMYSGKLGVMETSLDFNNLPEGQIFTAGSTWNFQLWYRDHNPGATSNTSPGATVRFCN